MKTYLLSIFIFISIASISQNLVVNPGFERIQRTDTVYENNIIEAQPWIPGNYATPNLHSELFPDSFIYMFYKIPQNGHPAYPAYQYSRTGKSMAGIVPYSNIHVPNDGYDYLLQNFTNTLDSGIAYRIGFYANLRNNSNWAINRMGLYLSSANPYDSLSFVLPYTPQIAYDTNLFLSDTSGWMRVSDTFTAIGNEQYICIGNFYDNQYVDTLAIYHPWYTPGTLGMSYYFIDDVFICRTDTIYPIAKIGKQDTTICYGDSIQLGTRNDSNYYYRWWPSQGLISDSTGTTWVKPLKTTIYYLEATDDCFDKTYDSITVYVKKCGPNAGMDTLVCREQLITLGDSSNIPYHCQWTPDTLLSSDTIALPIMTTMTSMTYYLTVSNASTIIKTDSVNIIVGDCYFAEAGIDSLICKGDSLQIGMQLYSFIDYSWSPNFMISDTAIGNPMVWPDTLTWYFLQVVDTMGNISYDSVLVDVQVCTGIESVKAKGKSKKIKVYPNPANNSISIDIGILNNADFILFDSFGRKVIRASLSSGSNSIKSDQIADGIYYYVVENNGNRLDGGKIIISH